MANEEYNDQSGEHEEEYHYTDEQPEYDLSTEKQAEKPAAAASRVTIKSLGERIRQNKRIVFGVVAFLFLLGIVYRMLVPVTSTTGSSEITQTATQTNAQPKKITQTVTTTHVAPTQPQPSRDEIAKLSTAAAMQPESSQVSPSADLIKQLTDRVSSLEQQNTAIMNLLQTQFVQKISDADTQRSQMRTQMKELELHVEAMESAFHQLTKLIPSSTPAMPSHGPQTAEASQAVTGYTVQAIIPGRAWLKSDSGEVLTVADGDSLKGVGRITRIDPYDGVVTIDTGKKIITLTYGMSEDQV